MKRVKQLSLFLDNKPGVLAKICAVLSKRKVNILGLSVIDGHDHAVARMVVDDPRTAVHCLGSAGVLVVENDVLMLDVPNRAGALGAIAGSLAKADLNIEYSYCTAGPKQVSANLVICVNDLPKARRVLSHRLKKTHA